MKNFEHPINKLNKYTIKELKGFLEWAMDKRLEWAKFWDEIDIELKSRKKLTKKVIKNKKL